MTDGTRIVAAARGWLGTRFHHQGRVKKTPAHKGGVDCLGLLIGVAGELGLAASDGKPISALDETGYPHYPDTERLRHALARALIPITLDDICAGDVALLNMDGNPQHLGIISESGLIHAYAPARAVVEHVLDEWWMRRIVSAYRVTHN